VSSDVETARRRYRAALDELRETMLGRPWAADPRVRAAAEHAVLQVEAAAYHQVIAPHTGYPQLSPHAAFPPLTFSHSLPAADFLYRRALLDGAREYRITGRRGGSAFVDFQVMNVGYGGDDPRKVGNWDLDGFSLAPDGSFEITVSAREGERNRIALDGASGQNFLTVREAFDEWSAPGAQLRIESIGSDPGPPEHDAAELCTRLDRAEAYVRFILDGWAVALTDDLLAHAGPNTIYADSFAADQGAANNPAATYPTALWEIGPDQALILEAEAPPTGFWSVQLGDLWWQVLDYTHHQTSLNGRQAVLDADGRFRAVLAHTDPGVPNWLDTLGHPSGILIFRYFRTGRAVHPTIRVVEHAKIRDHLPGGTAVIAPGERAATLEARARASRQRYGL
jgi:hypothetical protein